MRPIYALAMCVAVTVSGAAHAQKADKLWDAMNASKPADIAHNMDIYDEDMETFVQVSSEPIYQMRGRFGGPPLADSYLLATIDRKTADVSYRFVMTGTVQRVAPRLRRVNGEGPDGPVELDFIQGATDVLGCERFGCSYGISLEAVVPRAVLDWAATKPVSTPWKVRIGMDVGAGDRETSPVEIAAFLMRVDAIRARMEKPAEQ